MSLIISGATYFLMNELAESIGVSRQTLWRWLQSKKIPRGHKFQGRFIVFSEEEASTIKQYSNMLEPITELADREKLQ